MLRTIPERGAEDTPSQRERSDALTNVDCVGNRTCIRVASDVARRIAKKIENFNSYPEA